LTPKKTGKKTENWENKIGSRNNQRGKVPIGSTRFWKRISRGKYNLVAALLSSSPFFFFLTVAEH